MNIALIQAEKEPSRRMFTTEDLRRMIDAGVINEDERIELVEGELVMMAAKGILHERFKLELARAMIRAAPDDLAVGVDTTLRLTDTILLEPDKIGRAHV